MDETLFKNIKRAFMLLSVKFEDTWVQRTLNQYWLTEKSILENWERLFSYKCDILAKIFYAKLSGGKDQAKIYFSTFYSLLKGLIDDQNLENMKKVIFNILDVKN